MHEARLAGRGHRPRCVGELFSAWRGRIASDDALFLYCVLLFFVGLFFDEERRHERYDLSMFLPPTSMRGRQQAAVLRAQEQPAVLLRHRVHGFSTPALFASSIEPIVSRLSRSPSHACCSSAQPCQRSTNSLTEGSTSALVHKVVTHPSSLIDVPPQSLRARARRPCCSVQHQPSRAPSGWRALSGPGQLSPPV